MKEKEIGMILKSTNKDMSSSKSSENIKLSIPSLHNSLNLFKTRSMERTYVSSLMDRRVLAKPTLFWDHKKMASLGNRSTKKEVSLLEALNRYLSRLR